MKLIFDLFITFFKIGIMTFGGGMAMLPILEKEVVEKKGWSTKEELLDYYAVAQCTPGIIAVNVATFIGHKLKGIKGGIFATIGVVCPSVIIILIIANFLKAFSSYTVVKKAFTGIRVAVCALVISTVIGLYKKGIKDFLGIIIVLSTFGIIIFFNLSPIYIVICAVIIGISYSLLKEKRK